MYFLYLKHNSTQISLNGLKSIIKIVVLKISSKEVLKLLYSIFSLLIDDIFLVTYKDIKYDVIIRCDLDILLNKLLFYCTEFKLNILI